MARTTGSDELYRLVHSLTTEEKGYFKKFAKRHTDKSNAYIRLFDTLNKMEKYDEPLLKKKFKSLPDLKHYLFEMLLQSMVTSGSGALPVDEAMKGLLQINVLVRKGLTARALKQVKHLKEFSQEQGMHIWAGIFTRSQDYLVIASATPQQSITLANNLYEEIKTATINQQQCDALIHYQRVLYGFLKMKEFSGVAVDIDKEIDIAPLLGIQPVNSVHRAIQLSALKAYYSIKEETEKAYECCEEAYAIQRKRWQQLQSSKESINYYVAIEMLLHACINTGRIARAEKVLHELMKLDLSDTHLKDSLPIKINYFQLLFYWLKGEHDKGLKQWGKLNHVESIKLKDAFYPTMHYETYFFKAMFEFSTGKFTEASQSLNYFNQPGLSPNAATQIVAAEMLRLLIQFEIENYYLLPSAARSIKNRFKNLGEADYAFLKLVAKYGNNPPVFFSECAKARLEVSIHPMSISDWIESKVSKKPLAEIVCKNHSPN